MVKSNTSLKRDYYSLTDAAKHLEYEIADLIYLAADGKIPLYVIADHWEAKSVYQYDHSIDADAPDYDARYSEWRSKQNSKDLVINNRVSYTKKGAYQALYEITYDGLLPVAIKSLQEFRSRPNTAMIEIDMYRELGLADEAMGMFMAPENEVLVRDALNSEKLVVKAEDIKRLLNSENGPDETKPDGAVSRHTLLRIVIGLAKTRFKYDPKIIKSTVPKDIENDLIRVDVLVTDDTIRKALKEANSLPPPETA